ncbi:hypothetical protein [Devosia sp.]
MKHDAQLFPQGLPDAPLAMPKQMLERRSSLFLTIRALVGLAPHRT